MLDYVPDAVDPVSGTDPTSPNGSVRVRQLPDGAFQKAVEIGWNGRLLEIDVCGGGFPIRAPLEMELGRNIYWGALRQRTGSSHIVLVEHSVDRAKLDLIEKTWG